LVGVALVSNTKIKVAVETYQSFPRLLTMSAKSLSENASLRITLCSIPSNFFVR